MRRRFKPISIKVMVDLTFILGLHLYKTVVIYQFALNWTATSSGKASPRVLTILHPWLRENWVLKPHRTKQVLSHVARNMVEIKHVRKLYMATRQKKLQITDFAHNLLFVNTESGMLIIKTAVITCRKVAQWETKRSWPRNVACVLTMGCGGGYICRLGHYCPAGERLWRGQAPEGPPGRAGRAPVSALRGRPARERRSAPQSAPQQATNIASKARKCFCSGTFVSFCSGTGKWRWMHAAIVRNPARVYTIADMRYASRLADAISCPGGMMSGGTPETISFGGPPRKA